MFEIWIVPSNDQYYILSLYLLCLNLVGSWDFQDDCAWGYHLLHVLLVLYPSQWYKHMSFWTQSIYQKMLQLKFWKGFVRTIYLLKQVWSTGYAYFSMAPDPTSDIFRGPSTPILWFLFPIGLIRLIIVRYFCHFNLVLSFMIQIMIAEAWNTIVIQILHSTNFL
jgi:hypothetical protein